MSAVETLGARPTGQQTFEDCACPQPALVTLEGTARVGTIEDCACPTPVDVVPTITGVSTLLAVETPVVAQPAVAPAIKVSVVVPQA